MEFSISGFKRTGSWSEIVAFGELISQLLKEEGVDGKVFEEWEHWRPKVHEALGDEVNKKTADQTSITHGPGEGKGLTGTGDIVRAGRKLIDSPKDAAQRDMDKAGEDVRKSAGYISRALDTISRKVIRKIEEPVYRYLMTQISPLYFDNAIIAANLGRKSSLRSDRYIFVFEVGITDDELREEIEARLREIEEERKNS
jgi:hypothetical protein